MPSVASIFSEVGFALCNDAYMETREKLRSCSFSMSSRAQSKKLSGCYHALMPATQRKANLEDWQTCLSS